jgi:oligoribonuclease
MQRNDLLAWMDLEFTSLKDARTEQIIEIAVLLTDRDLNVVAEGPDIVIHAERTQFEHIDAGAKELHTKSGIIDAATASSVTVRQAEEQVLAFLKAHAEPGTAPLCGNSIHVDRHYLRMQMPELEAYLFYRCIDVSSFKEVLKRWKPDIYEAARAHKGETSHRAKDDILASISELRFYKGALFS